MRPYLRIHRGQAYNGVVVLPVLAPIETDGDVVVMGLKDFYSLVELIDDRNPGIAQEIREKLDPQLHG